MRFLKSPLEKSSLKKLTNHKLVQFICAMRMKIEIFVIKEAEFHKIDEVSNVGHVLVMKNSGNEEYKKKNIKNFNISSQQIMV